MKQLNSAEPAHRHENPSDAFTLVQGESRCDIMPGVGGSIGGWTVGGQQMLRTASAGAVAAGNPFGMASFPLVPYSNRIGNGTFDWDEKPISLARNFPPEPHAIHGVGFERPWECLACSCDSAHLRLIHRADAGWPWPFEARQRVTITERELTLDLIAVNLAPRPVPLAFGHHPYFPLSGAVLTFRARGVWLSGEDGLPKERVKPTGNFDYSKGAPIERGDLDHCFTGWTGPASIAWPDKPLTLEISASWGLPCAVVCIRKKTDDFCFEPVPHINNALNLPDLEPAMPIIAPGEAFRATIRFRAVAR